MGQKDKMYGAPFSSSVILKEETDGVVSPSMYEIPDPISGLQPSIFIQYQNQF